MDPPEQLRSERDLVGGGLAMLLSIGLCSESAMYSCGASPSVVSLPLRFPALFIASGEFLCFGPAVLASVSGDGIYNLNSS